MQSHSALTGAEEPMFESVATAEINVPVEAIDLGDWLFGLTSGEYQACSRDHIACGSTLSSDGRRVSINVETIGGDVLVQHYVEDVVEPTHCRVRSVSDLFHALGQCTIEIIWDLSVRPLSPDRCGFSNRITANATPDLLDLLARHGVPVLAAAARMRELADAHNAEETPAFARSIEDRAMGRPQATKPAPVIDQEGTILAETRCSAVIQASIDKIDLANWVFGLSDAEYQGCSIAHLAAAVSRVPDGQRLSVNVEKLESLIIQQYQEVLSTRHHCRIVSPRSDIFASGGRSTLHVVWDMSATAIDADRSEFVNAVVLRSTPEFDAALSAQGVPLEMASARLLSAVTAHNREETPKFAADIERKASS